MRLSNLEHEVKLLATKMDHDIQNMSLTLTIRLGSLMVVGIMALAALIKF